MKFSFSPSIFVFQPPPAECLLLGLELLYALGGNFCFCLPIGKTNNLYAQHCESRAVADVPVPGTHFIALESG